MQFAHPKILYLFLVFVPLIAWYVAKQRTAHPSLGISSLRPFARFKNSRRRIGFHVIFALKLASIGFLIIVLARPQSHDRWNESTVEGTDIVLSIDLSSSMLARDFKPDRLGAAKSIAASFVSGRENDNIGLVIFAGESLTGVPMTNDRAVLVNYINSLNENMLEDGTAIGDGLATAINRIKNGKAKSKSIVLLTDGSNNTGIIQPMTAAEIAKELGIKVYTIGVGKNGMADYPTIDYFGRVQYVKMPVIIDEETLKGIADTTGGRYFRAENNASLQQIFDEIDRLETTVLDIRNFSSTSDDYQPWALIALACLALAFILRFSLLRNIP